MVFRTPVELALDYHFERPELLACALTHSTFVNEHPADAGGDNQRLEFLGDAVIGLLASRLLYERMPDGDEGALSRRRSQMVRCEALAARARELDLGAHLRVGQSQKEGTHTDSTLADAFEALAAAVFLDGGWDAAQRHMAPVLMRALDNATGASDNKTALQEVCHAHGLAQPQYVVVATEGPAHARSYACEVRIGDRVCGQGRGSSKKVAEQACAAVALASLEKEWAK